MNQEEEYFKDLIPKKLRGLNISNNRTYRFADIINKKGPSWKEAASKVIANEEKYKNTILFRYLEKNGVFGEKNVDLLRSIAIEKSKKHMPYIPAENDLVIYIRLGDTFNSNHPHSTMPVEETYSKLLISILSDKNQKYTKIIFCTVLFYAGHGGELHSIDEYSFKKSIRLMTRLTSIAESKSVHWEIQSSTDADVDFCYMAGCTNFIPSVSQFSELAIQCTFFKKEKIYTDILDMFYESRQAFDWKEFRKKEAARVL
jgi:hypothetical protein